MEFLVVLYFVIGVLTILVSYQGGLDNKPGAVEQFFRDCAGVLFWPVVWVMVYFILKDESDV